jgi:collagen type VII alpha
MRKFLAIIFAFSLSAAACAQIQIGGNGVTFGPVGATGSTGVPGPQGVIGNTGPTGAKGDTGATGMTGSTGSTGAAGPVGMQYKGPWSSGGGSGAGGSYNTNDVATYSGSTYISTASSNSSTPPASPWSLLAAVGSTGATGNTGMTGATGGTGAAGAAGTVTVGTTTGLAPGVSPTVSNSGTSTAAILNFGIPTPFAATALSCSSTVTFSGTSTVNNLQLDCSVSSSTIVAGTPGQCTAFQFYQPSGNRTFTWPTNVIGTFAPRGLRSSAYACWNQPLSVWQISSASNYQ